MKEVKEIPAFVVCLSNRGHAASLVVRRLYQRVDDAVAASHDMVRIIDESGEDYAFPAAMFAEVALPKPLATRLARAA